MPQYMVLEGQNAWWIDPNQFTFVAGPGSASKELSNAFARFRAICFPHRATSRQESAGNSSIPTRRITVMVHSPLEQVLALGTDESYNLTLTTDVDGSIAAATVFGAYHALESFAQLLQFDFDAKV